MPKTVEFQDPNRLELIRELKKSAREEKAEVWKALAKELSRPRRSRREVNIWRINQNTKDGEIIVVPGKVLGDGRLDHRIKIAAFKFSDNAIDKIEKSGGKYMSISDLVKENPKGSNIRIIG